MSAGPRYSEKRSGRAWKRGGTLSAALRRVGTDGGSGAGLDHAGDVLFDSVHHVDIFDPVFSGSGEAGGYGGSIDE